MRFVVDTNVLISALVAKAKTHDILVFGDLELFVPEYSLLEIEKHKDELCKRMEVNDKEFELALDIILSKVTVITREHYSEFETKAKLISPDYLDYPFFALAMALNAPLWTNESRLKKQNDVRVYDTTEILRLLNIV